jgi:LuxR family transcriptional regulator of spore coat protein
MTPPLSPRQREVLHLVSHGHSNKEIARRLGIEDSSVRTHLVLAFKRLGARNRAHATALFIRENTA